MKPGELCTVRHAGDRFAQPVSMWQDVTVLNSRVCGVMKHDEVGLVVSSDLVGGVRWYLVLTSRQNLGWINWVYVVGDKVP